MPLPADGPATLGTVKGFLGIAPTDEADDAAIGVVVAAVNAKVQTFRCASVAEGADDWAAPEAAAVVQGAVMLAARLWRRRNTPDGVVAFGGDAALYVQRNDPDVAMLLSLGSYGKPAVG